MRFFFSIWCILPFSLFAQERVLSFNEAMAIALEKNYDIRVESNNARVAEIENNLGNAGFLPRLDLNTNAGFSNNRSRQEFSSGSSVNRSGLRSNNINAGLYLTWTVFDGFKMFATKERLEILQQQGELALKLQMENTVDQLSDFYYLVVRQQQLIRGIQASMDVTEQRVKIAQKKKELGSGSNVELLQARMDRNEQRSNLLAQRSLLKEYKNQLEMLMQWDSTGDYTVDTLFNFEQPASIDEIRTKIETQNRSLLFSKNDVLVNRQLMREIRSQKYPRVGLNSSYVFGRSENAAGLVLLNQNLGYSMGLSVSWNLFNGFITRNQVKVQEYRILNSNLRADQTRAALFTEASTAYTRWLNDRETVEIEEETIRFAEQSLFINTERLRLGLGNYLELKESQSSFEAANTRLVNARYNLKRSETRLKRLSAELIP